MSPATILQLQLVPRVTSPGGFALARMSGQAEDDRPGSKHNAIATLHSVCYFGLVFVSLGWALSDLPARRRELCRLWRVRNRGAGNARTTRAEDPSLGTGAATEPLGAKMHRG
jgi:hypothetical protein